MLNLQTPDLCAQLDRMKRLCDRLEAAGARLGSAGYHGFDRRRRGPRVLRVCHVPFMIAAPAIERLAEAAAGDDALHPHEADRLAFRPGI